MLIVDVALISHSIVLISCYIREELVTVQKTSLAEVICSCYPIFSPSFSNLVAHFNGAQHSRITNKAQQVEGYYLVLILSNQEPFIKVGMTKDQKFPTNVLVKMTGHLNATGLLIFLYSSMSVPWLSQLWWDLGFF